MSGGTIERVHAKAEAEGLVVLTAASNELFIDIDDSLDINPVVAKLRLIHKHYPILRVMRRVSKGGNGLHVRVVMAATLDARERCALHAIAGSDPVRELLRLKAIKHDTDDQPSIFLDNPFHPEDVLMQLNGDRLVLTSELGVLDPAPSAVFTETDEELANDETEAIAEELNREVPASPRVC